MFLKVGSHLSKGTAPQGTSKALPSGGGATRLEKQLVSTKGTVNNNASQQAGLILGLISSSPFALAPHQGDCILTTPYSRVNVNLRGETSWCRCRKAAPGTEQSILYEKRSDPLQVPHEGSVKTLLRAGHARRHERPSLVALVATGFSCPNQRSTGLSADTLKLHTMYSTFRGTSKGFRYYRLRSRAYFREGLFSAGVA